MRGSLLLIAILVARVSAGAEISWTSLPVMPTTRSGPAGASLNGHFYVIGGGLWSGASTGAVERFDPASGAWSSRASLGTSRWALAVAVVGGKIYAIGGESEGLVRRDTVEEYDPATNAWTPRAAMTTARSGVGAAALNGLIYAVGGYNAVSLTTNQQYNPGTNSWATKAPMSFARHDAGVAEAGGKIYAVGGYNGGSYLTVVESYDSSLNTWSTKNAMPAGRASFSLIALQGRLYAVSGSDGTLPYLTTVAEFDPATNTWASRQPISVGRISFAGAAISASLYIAGGTDSASYLNAAERGALVDELALAADSTGLIWSTGGNASWFVESTVTHDGVDALQSGNINNSQSSFVEATLTGPGSLTYYWKVSSESGYDYLRFFIDGVEQAGKISGTVDWTLKQFQIAAGDHVLRWAYTKDASASVGTDAGWLDHVTWTPAGQASGGQLLGPEGLMAVAAPGVVIAPNVVDLSRNPSPVFRFRRGKPSAKITWTVFDGTGRSVRRGEAALDAAGDGSVVFDLLDDGATRLAPGAYVVALSGGSLSGRRTPFLVVAKRAP